MHVFRAYQMFYLIHPSKCTDYHKPNVPALKCNQNGSHQRALQHFPSASPSWEIGPPKIKPNRTECKSSHQIICDICFNGSGYRNHSEQYSEFVGVHLVGLSLYAVRIVTSIHTNTCIVGGMMGISWKRKIIGIFGLFMWFLSNFVAMSSAILFESIKSNRFTVIQTRFPSLPFSLCFVAGGFSLCLIAIFLYSIRI